MITELLESVRRTKENKNSAGENGAEGTDELLDKLLLKEDFQQACLQYLEQNDESILQRYIEEYVDASGTSYESEPVLEKEQMVKHIIGLIEKVREKFSYLNEARQWDKQLIEPLTVSVSSNRTFNVFSKVAGADLMLQEINEHDLEKLAQFSVKLKTSLASLRVEALRSDKKKFYQSVEDGLDNRSEITADTAKEMEIFGEIFGENHKIRKILDIGCGYGRIDLQLLKKGYDVTGLDANQQFLDVAREKARNAGFGYDQARFDKGDIIDYDAGLGKFDSVIYTWHSILEAFGPGNLLNTLNCAFKSLRRGGILVFDQPTRENPQMEDGWYGHDPDGEHKYLSYVMDEDEIKFILRIVGFENVNIRKWKTKPSDDYPDGMHKFTVSAEKPS
jgi:SAM-dependent methyltransferase